MSEPPLVLVAVRRTPVAPPTGAERVRVQRAHARETLGLASAEAGGPGGPWPQEEDGGRPLPLGGWHWSISHDAHLTVGGLARVPLGVDTERIQERRLALAERVLDADERALLDGLEASLAFTRTWCAKEAVLKARGIGMAGLSRCRVQRLEDEGPHLCLHLRLDGEDWRVEQVRVDDSVVAVTAPGPAWRLAWAETEVGPLPLRP